MNLPPGRSIRPTWWKVSTGLVRYWAETVITTASNVLYLPRPIVPTVYKKGEAIGYFSYNFRLWKLPVGEPQVELNV